MAEDAAQPGRLHLAISKNSTPAVVEYLSRGRIRLEDPHEGQTPLMRACQAGNLDMVLALVAAGADVAADGACRKRNAKVTGKALSGLEADGMPAEHRLGWTPLMYACSEGHLSIAEFLLSNGADVNQKDRIRNCWGSSTNAFDYTALLCACKRGHHRTAELLLSKGADTSASVQCTDEKVHSQCTRHAETALMLACRAGDSKLAQLLVAAGADLNQVACHGWTALTFACNDGHLDVVEILLRHGADTSILCRQGWTALTHACDKGHPNVVKLLLRFGADTSIEVPKSLSILTYACHKGHQDVVKLLLNHGVDASHNIDVREDLTALYRACSQGHMETVVQLIAHGVDPRQYKLNGRTLLKVACTTGNIKLAMLLLGLGVDAAAPSPCEHYMLATSPLADACSQGSLELVALLLSQGAQVDGCLDLYLEYACKGGHAAVVNLLLSQAKPAGAPDRDKMVSLMTMASTGGHLEVVKVLLQAAPPIDHEAHVQPMSTAFEHGHVAIIKVLLEAGAPTGYHAKGLTPLLAACKAGYTELVQILLAQGADATVRSEDYFPHSYGCSIKRRDYESSGLTALMLASREGHTDVCRVLLASSADINTTVRFHDDRTALYFASENGHTDVVCLLLAHQPDLSAFDQGPEALEAACRGRHVQTAQLLVAAGLKVNPACLASNASYFYDAATVEFVLQQGADAKAQDEEGRTALMCACKSRTVELSTVQMLLNAGANVSAQDNKGCSAMMYICSNSYSDMKVLCSNILLELLAAGAELSKKDNQGADALMYACTKGRSLRLVQLLLSRGAGFPVQTEDNDANIEFVEEADRLCGKSCTYSREFYHDLVTCLRRHNEEMQKWGCGYQERDITEDEVLQVVERVLLQGGNVNAYFKQAPALTAAQRGYAKVLTMLLAHGCAVDSEGRTALMCAATGSPECVQILLLNGADVSVQDQQGQTALMYAANTGASECVQTQNAQRQCVQILLQNGASTSVQDQEGKTALMLAASFGYTECVQSLLMSSADVSVQDHQGKTALMWGLEGHDLECVQLLLRYDADTSAQDQQGVTALMCAAKMLPEAVPALLLNGANFLAKDEQGWTALMHAAAENNARAVQSLLLSGADPSVRDKEGKTAALLAACTIEKWLRETSIPWFDKEKDSQWSESEEEEEEGDAWSDEEEINEDLINKASRLMRHGLSYRMELLRLLLLTETNEQGNKVSYTSAIAAIVESCPVTAVLLTKQANTYYVMFLGETGSGKSTLLNMFVNFFRGPAAGRTSLPKPQDIKAAVPTAHVAVTEPEGARHSERNTQDRTKSQSTKCVPYIFTYTAQDGRQVTIHVTDTPGLSDTEGADDKHLDKILEAAARLPHISAIVLLANGSASRLTMSMKNVFTLLRGHLPDAVIQNSLAVLSNCSQSTRNLDPKVLPVHVKEQHLFLMQNSAFSSDPTRWEDAEEEDLHSLTQSWVASMRIVQQIADLLVTLPAASSSAFIDMRELRREIKASVASAISDLRNMQKLQDVLEQAQAARRGAAEDSERYKRYSQATEIEESIIVPAASHHILCSICRAVCHGNYGAGDAGAARLSDSHIFGGTDGHCSECKGHCSSSSHYIAAETIRKSKRSVESVLDEMKKKYEEAERQVQGAAATAAQVEADLALVKRAQQKQLEEIKRLCRSIKSIASGFNLVNELTVSLNALVMAAKQLTSANARDRAEESIRDLQSFIDQLLGQGLQGDGHQETLQDSVHALAAHSAHQAGNSSGHTEDRQHMARRLSCVEKTLQEVSQYRDLMTTPERAAAAPGAASMAACAEERLQEEKEVLSQQLACLSTEACIGSAAKAQLTVPPQQIAGVVKLLANKGKRREAIATATGCRISVPSMEDWDGENDVVIAFEGGNIDTAQQLIAQALKA